MAALDVKDTLRGLSNQKYVFQAEIRDTLNVFGNSEQQMNNL